MKPRSLLLLALALGLTASLAGANTTSNPKKSPHPSFGKVQDVEGLPRVLLILL